MCGRYTLIRPAAEVATVFKASDYPAWKPRYNVAPTRSVFVIRKCPGGRTGSLLCWGLGTFRTAGGPLFNARAETVTEKPTFLAAFRQRRCLVPADGFFEWTTEGGRKQPHYFTLTDSRLFAFAGLWERGEGFTGPVESVAILKTKANDLVRPVHDRMPVILTPEGVCLRLDYRQEGERLRHLLHPYPASDMAVRRVSTTVGSARNEGPKCVESAGPSQATFF